MDEPLGALDFKLRETMQVELRRIQSELKITTLSVTHDQREALTMSDRIAVMNEGHIEQVGKPEEIYEKPATRFVANFIGMINSFEGEIRAAVPEGFEVDVQGGISLRAAQSAPGANVNRRVTVAVRPEYIELLREDCGAKSEGDKDRNFLAGQVERIQYSGSHTFVYFRSTGGIGLTVETNPQSERLIPGDRAIARWRPRYTLLWPK